MALELPQLDDRTSQDIVKQALELRSRFCPDWTDDNLSDPGRTLIELFAWMMEMTLYRLNQVPEKNYIAFLNLLGVQLKPPQPAQVDLTFTLSKEISGTDTPVVVPAGIEVAAAKEATEAGSDIPSISFYTDEKLVITPIKLLYVLSGSKDETGDLIDHSTSYQESRPLILLGSPPHIEDCLYLGFLNPMLNHTLKITLEGVEGVSKTSQNWPKIFWEWWNGRQWEEFSENRKTEILTETSYTIELNIPGGQEDYPDPKLYEKTLANKKLKACWIKARLVKQQENQSGSVAVQLRVVTKGATVSASHAIIVRDEELGRSSGEPGQIFRVKRPPILPITSQIELPDVELCVEGDPEKWIPQHDFSNSTAKDVHFVCDMVCGEVRFGPAIRGADGTMVQLGKIPLQDARIKLNYYRTGGGLQANVASGWLTVLKNPIPFVKSVINREPAHGGCDPETLEQAKWRTSRQIRSRDRAVSYQDFEDLALQVPGVARVRCWAVEGHRVVERGSKNHEGKTEQNYSGDPPPGTVRVLIVPDLQGELKPTPNQLKVNGKPLEEDVRNFLDSRRLLCTRLEIKEPEYVWVSVNIGEIWIHPKAEPKSVQLQVEKALYEFLHPLCGGVQGKGWPFGMPLQVTDIYALVQRIPGVRYVKRIELRVPKYEVLPKEAGLDIQVGQEIELQKHQLIVSSLRLPHQIPWPRVMY